VVSSISPNCGSVSPLVEQATKSHPLSNRVHSVHEKSWKMLEFGIKTLRPLKVLENR